MIFERLIVERYGHFERLDLDLGTSGGLAVIHGHNESGKSTLLHAVRDLFFGIDERTPFAYAFDYRSIHLRAVLRDSAGQHLAIERRKKRKNPLTGTLTSQAGVVDLDEERFSKYFGGVTADLYSSLFGFSLDDLQRGAELLGGAGLGEILGGSSLGGSGEQIRQTLRQLRGEADDLYKRHGKNPAINRLLLQLEEARRGQREATLQLSHYQGLTERLTRIRGEVEEVDRRIVDLRARRERAQLLGAVADELAERERLRRRLADLGHVGAELPDLAEADARAILDLLGALERQAPTRTRLRAEVARLQE
ncbi:MAG: AAA family ATPase, partial [Nannocystaceae bacterium]